eukprot:112350-Chlamydomonas_euryale.AAC.7
MRTGSGQEDAPANAPDVRRRTVSKLLEGRRDAASASAAASAALRQLVRDRAIQAVAIRLDLPHQQAQRRKLRRERLRLDRARGGTHRCGLLRDARRALGLRALVAEWVGGYMFGVGIQGFGFRCKSWVEAVEGSRKLAREGVRGKG